MLLGGENFAPDIKTLIIKLLEDFTLLKHFNIFL